MTEQEAKCKVLELARSEIGLHETGDNHVPFLDGDWDDRLYGFNAQDAPWCDSWFDDKFIRCFGYETGRDMLYQFDGCCGAACEPSAEYYRQHGAFYNYPEIGDQIFFYSGGCIGHTGLVESINGSTVVTIEGNYSDSVCRNNYPIGNSNIAGYGRPNWRLAADVSDEDPTQDETEQESDVAADNNITIVDAPVEEAAAPYVPTVHVCRPGEFGSWFVYGLQYLLKYRGHYIQADGAYGIITAKHVKAFQRKNNLEADALVGPLTWAALYDGIELSIGDSGYAVRALQYLLRAQDYMIFTDEIFGTQLYTQLLRFQESRGLTPNGICSKETWDELVRE